MKVLIYREELLPYSETFIPQQVDAMKDVETIYAGTTLKTPGIKIDESRCLTMDSEINQKKLVTWTFRGLGWAPPAWSKAVSKFAPNIIHAHFGPDGTWCLPLAKKLKVPLLVTFHGYDISIRKPLGFAYNLYLQRRKKLFRDGKAFIAISNFIRQKLLEAGCPSEKIHEHYIGIDPYKFEPDPSIPREQIVLFVGRLVEKKGCAYLIRAMAQVQKVLPEAKLVVIGSGPLQAELEILAGRLLQNYHFLGAQTPEQIKAWMNKAQAFCVPSVIAENGDAEGFGIVFAEAQSMNLPVVSFNSGGIPEAVSHEESGLLAPEKDVDKLAEYLILLLSNSALWQELSVRGRERILKNFNLHTQSQKLVEIYNNLLRS